MIPVILLNVYIFEIFLNRIYKEFYMKNQKNRSEYSKIKFGPIIIFEKAINHESVVFK